MRWQHRPFFVTDQLLGNSVRKIALHSRSDSRTPLWSENTAPAYAWPEKDVEAYTSSSPKYQDTVAHRIGDSEKIDILTRSNSGEVGAKFCVGGSIDGYLANPIHESITFAALGHCSYNMAPGTTLAAGSNAQWEYVRGAIFNDDPDSLLFDDSENQNHEHSSGLTWLAKFKMGKYDWAENTSDKMTNATGRSHFGDLQFLHCMASDSSEKAQATKDKIMIWVEVLWKLATGEDGINADTVIGKSAIGQFLPDGSAPDRNRTFKSLLGGDTKFANLDIQRRAFGSMLHFIQDSYALGHTRRVLQNPQDVKTKAPKLSMKLGRADRWGPIRNFHVYNGQDEENHKHYDHYWNSVPQPDNLGNLNQFNYLLGTRDAVDKCIELIQLRQAGKQWNTGISEFFDTQVFALADPNASADAGIWP